MTTVLTKQSQTQAQAQAVNQPVPTVVAIHRLVWISILAALTAVGAIISIPISPFSPVPITLQTMFVLLTGLILGSKRGVYAILIYILAGCVGLPVFAGGKAGLAVLIGPTGGFLLGFIPSVMFCGLASKNGQNWSLPLLIAICIVATAITLTFGTIQLSLVLDISIYKALLAGTVPFLPGEFLKIVSAASMFKFLAARNLLPA
ncbi:MAG: biotin transporter BioY [Deltaproteobacteria bacterium]|jgi:biotin transport system substrate-specific component|nr:biotin transporter BioY [Deltaproteobacteria bacterium]